MNSISLTAESVQTVAALRPSARLQIRPAVRVSRAGIEAVALYALLLVIGSVSACDTYWTFKNQDVMLGVEQNPVGRWLIQLDNGDVALFMTCKMIGTMIVLTAIPQLGRFRKSWCLPIAGAVATFQVLLFVYLTWSERLVQFS